MHHLTAILHPQTTLLRSPCINTSPSAVPVSHHPLLLHHHHHHQVSGTAERRIFVVPRNSAISVLSVVCGCLSRGCRAAASRKPPPHSAPMADVLVVFDFDKTIIDCDSDNWVVDELGFTDRFNELLPTMPWNSLMDKLMGEIHSSGITTEQIADVLKRVPIHPRIVPSIKAIHALGCELRIVSDANLFFIETILNHLGIRECFSEINTNPGYVDEQGRLRISPFHDFHTSSHGCSLCPSNMCKGIVIERIKASLSAAGSRKRFIYLGDGAGDYCPSLKLRENDFVMPRKNYPVWDLICRNPMLIKAEIHEWTNGEDQEQVLQQIIEKIVTGESKPLIASTDCKLQTMSVSAAHEALLPALPVPQ